MPYRLSFDGVDDRFTTPLNITFDTIEIDFSSFPETWHQYINVGLNKNVNRNGNNNGIQLGSDIAAAYVNGVQVFNNADFLPVDTRVTFKMVLNAVFTNSSAGVTFMSNSVSQFVLGSVWSIKFYNGANLVVHYDFTTGTAQDQTGNGKHGTVTGATFVDEAPAGVDVSYTYAMRQTIYTNRSTAYATKQAVTANRSGAFAMLQNVYANRSAAYATRQSVFANRSTPYATRQAVFANRSTAYATRQSAFAMRSTVYPMVQNVFSDYTPFVAVYAMRQVITKPVAAAYPMRQEIFKATRTDFAMNQIIIDPDERPVASSINFVVEIRRAAAFVGQISRERKFNVRL